VVGEGLGDVHRTEDHQPGTGDDGLDEHLDVAVRQGGGHLPVDEDRGVLHRRFEAGREASGDDPFLEVEHGAAPHALAGDDGQVGPEPFLGDEPLQRGDGGFVGHHGSTNTWMVPPHASPTSNASSSEIP